MNPEIIRRLDRLEKALSDIRYERDDSAPRMEPCARGCGRFTRANICLVCKNEEPQKKGPK